MQLPDNVVEELQQENEEADDSQIDHHHQNRLGIAENDDSQEEMAGAIGAEAS